MGNKDRHINGVNLHDFLLLWSKVEVPTSVRSLSYRIRALPWLSLSKFLSGKSPFCLLLAASDTPSLTNKGGPLPFRFLARDMTRSSLNERNLTMIEHFPNGCAASISTSLLIFMLRCIMSRTLNSQSTNVSEPSSESPKIRLFLRLRFLMLSILDSVNQQGFGTAHDLIGGLDDFRTWHQHR